MATIRATCPTCGKVMEVGAERAGQEVECDECFQVFVAKGPGGKIKGAPTTKPTHKRRRDDDDDDYEHDHIKEYDEDDDEPRSWRGRQSDLRPAGTVLILGIVSIVFWCFPIIGIPVAVVVLLGPSSAHYAPGESTLVRVGKTLAWINISLLLIAIAIAISIAANG